jgi:methionine-rich copper-binding protein CopC
MRYIVMVLAAVGLGLPLWTVPAAAHAFLKKASPAVGSTLQQPPSEIAIEFTQGVEPAFSTITVQDAAGTGVEAGSVHLEGDNTHLAVGLKPLKPGTYKVVWHATSVDTHKTQGSFNFTVTP